MVDHGRCCDLVLAAFNDGGLGVGADGAGGRAESLNLLDNLHGLLVGDLAEDDVAAIEPRGDDGGNEELGTVARQSLSVSLEQPSGRELKGGLTCWDQRWPWRADRGGRACR